MILKGVLFYYLFVDYKDKKRNWTSLLNLNYEEGSGNNDGGQMNNMDVIGNDVSGNMSMNKSNNSFAENFQNNY